MGKWGSSSGKVAHTIHEWLPKEDVFVMSALTLEEERKTVGGFFGFGAADHYKLKASVHCVELRPSNTAARNEIRELVSNEGAATLENLKRIIASGRLLRGDSAALQARP